MGEPLERSLSPDDSAVFNIAVPAGHVRVVTVKHPWFSARVAVRRSDGGQIEDGINTAIIRGEPPGAYRIVVRPPDDASRPGRLTIQIRDALTPTAIAQRQAQLAAWIRATGFSLRTITPTDDDFSDLEPLAAKIGSARVVMLGEQTHNDGATLLAKARLLRFLHQRVGFDVLAWEGGFLDVARLEQELRRAVPFDSLPRRLYRNWWESAQVRPVFDYARNTHATTRPLAMAGIDPQMGRDTAYARSLLDFLVQADTGFITRSDEEAIMAEMTSVTDVLNAVRFRRDARDSLRDIARPAPALLSRLIDHVKTRRERYESIHGRETVAFHLQALENVVALEREIRVMVDSGGFASPKANNTRDRMMARNLVWLATERYPGRKIVVWAASFHIMRNPAFVDAGFDGMTTLGSALAELPLESFAIAFVTYSGRLGSVQTGEQWDVPPAPVSTFEALLHDLGQPYVFVDLRDTPSRPSWIRDGFVARPGGNVPQWSQWANQFDAFVFIDKMTPSTRAAGR